MVKTPIPRSLGRLVVSIFTGSPFDILWKVVLIVIGLLAILVLAQVGGYLTLAILGLLISAAWQDDVRRIYLDIWHRRFFKL